MPATPIAPQTEQQSTTPQSTESVANAGGGGAADQPWWLQSRNWPWLILAAGVLIRVRAYWQNPSLWGDESAVALNLLSRDFSQLTLKLDDHQGAPLGFLWLSKAAIELFGIHEYSLRLVPFLAGLLVLPLALMLFRKCFTGSMVLMAMLLVSGSSPLIYFCAELKQYSLDVVCALLVVFCALATLSPKATYRQYAALAALGSVLTWFSHSLILVLAGVGITLAVRAIYFKQWRECLVLALVGTCWLLSFSAQYVLLLQYHADDDFLMTYWADDFLPWPVSFNSALAWLLRIAYDEASYLTPYPLTWISIPLILLGVVSLARRSGSLCAMLVLPVFFGVLAAALHKFPYGQRLWLFAVPFGFILLTKGLRVVLSWQSLVGRAGLVAKIALVAALAAAPAYGFYKFTFRPPTKFAFREALDFYRLHALPGDPVYVDQSHDGLVQVYGFMQRFDFLGERPLTFGAKKLRTQPEIAKSLQPFSGQPRVWLLATKDEVTMLQLLVFADDQGRRLESHVANGSIAVLYDFTVPGK